MLDKVFPQNSDFDLLQAELLLVAGVQDLELVHRAILGRVVELGRLPVYLTAHIVELHDKTPVGHPQDLELALWLRLYRVLPHDHFQELLASRHYIFPTLPSFALVLPNSFALLLGVLAPEAQGPALEHSSALFANEGSHDSLNLLEVRRLAGGICKSLLGPAEIRDVDKIKGGFVFVEVEADHFGLLATQLCQHARLVALDDLAFVIFGFPVAHQQKLYCTVFVIHGCQFYLIRQLLLLPNSIKWHIITLKT